jgi:UDP:flavonoid glycosyltransferase YjiC (YdhE family)
LDFLLTTIGSHGDVHPFVGLAVTLKQRGHRVSLALNEHFIPLAERAGVETIPLGTDEEYRQGVNHPVLWRSYHGFKAVAGLIIPLIKKQYDLIEQRIVPGQTVVVASSLCLGARIARDKLKFPLASVHLSPAIFRSVLQPPRLPGMFLPSWAPRVVIRRLFDVADKWFVDPLIAPPINELRASLGLQPVSGIFRDWMNSPDLVIGTFPEWYAPPAPDWPPQTVLTGFPLWDERDLSGGAAPEGFYDFINAGEAPVVFTPGSAMWRGHEFFQTAVAACLRMRRRGILLSRHRDHIPANLPETVKHFDFIPFSQVLPQAAALVHHGGIGSCSQALAAGVRQLIMPMAHDQLDNAHRLEKLGVARVIRPRSFRPAKVARVIDSLLDDRGLYVRCHWVSQWFKGQRGLADTAKVLEELGESRSAAANPPVVSEAALPG